jgi:hypothetical protein
MWNFPLTRRPLCAHYFEFRIQSLKVIFLKKICSFLASSKFLKCLKICLQNHHQFKIEFICGILCVSLLPVSQYKAYSGGYGALSQDTTKIGQEGRHKGEAQPSGSKDDISYSYLYRYILGRVTQTKVEVISWFQWHERYKRKTNLFQCSKYIGQYLSSPRKVYAINPIWPYQCL